MSLAGSPTLETLRSRLCEPLSDALGMRVDPAQITLLIPPKAVADDPSKLLVADRRGRPVAVVLASAPSSPRLVADGLRKAREAKAALGAEVGAVILDPLAEGEVEGRSWGALVRCEPLTRIPGLRRLQRQRVAPRLLAWLEDVVRLTVAEPTGDEVQRDFVAALEFLRAQPRTSPRLSAAADLALERLGRGAWRPRYVLAHNDLWEGNVLFRPGFAARFGRYGRCVVIDWPASRVRGHAMLDLTRLWLSFRLDSGKFRDVVAAHCRLLGCEPVDARSHLIAALARLRLKLDHFPEENFLQMSESCLGLVDAACA